MPRSGPYQYRAASVSLLCVLLVAGRAAAQDLDRGTFSIVKAGSVVGHEAFVLRQGSNVTGPQGFVLTSIVTFPTERATITLTVQADYGPDSSLQQLQIDQAGARFAARFANRRATIRTLTTSHESNREYPLSAPIIPVSDSVFSYYLLLPGAAAKAVFFDPMNGRSASASETARTMDSVSVGGGRRLETHVTLGDGDERRHLWYDQAGKLVAIDLPRSAIRVERQ
jgi:hypothetical protein